MNTSESPLRRMMAETGAVDYHPLSSLAAAQADPQGIVVLEGDDGGQVYLVCPARDIACSEEKLQQLLVDLDEIEWPGNDDPSMRRVYYESRGVGEGVPVGTGGGQVTKGLWLHPRLARQSLVNLIRDVLLGKRDSIR